MMTYNSERPEGRISSSQKAVTVGLIGILEEDDRYLQAAFANSAHRNITYRLVPYDNGPDILLVNADAPVSLVQWVKYREAIIQVKGKAPPTVVMSRVRSFDTKHYQMRSPLITLRTLGILDQVATNELGAQQELAFAPGPVQPPVPIPVTPAQPPAAAAVPVAEAPPPIPAAPAPAVAPSARTSEIRALVVDDSLPVRVQMKQALLPVTSRIEFAEDGEKALELIGHNAYDIIFLDVILPGMDGYEICKVVKSGAHRHTPVIMLTSASSPADRVKGKLAGCDTYLIKPVGHAMFQYVIEHYLQHVN
jgi:twitching motility two-component system response regulator PilG